MLPTKRSLDVQALHLNVRLLHHSKCHLAANKKASTTVGTHNCPVHP